MQEIRKKNNVIHHCVGRKPDDIETACQRGKNIEQEIQQRHIDADLDHSAVNMFPIQPGDYDRDGCNDNPYGRRSGAGLHGVDHVIVGGAFQRVAKRLEQGIEKHNCNTEPEQY